MSARPLPSPMDAPTLAPVHQLLDRLRRGPALGGAITLLPRHRPLDEWQRHIGRRLGWGVRLLELRDDLFPDPLLAALLACAPPEQLLLSARRRRSPAELVALGQLARCAARLDWPLELGPCPAALDGSRIASLHARGPGEPLAEAGARLVAAGAGAQLLKLAVPVYTLRELVEGHAWAAAEPGRRVFLPSSPPGAPGLAGRWAWYRLWRGDGQALNFVRERPGCGTAPSPDQPSLLEWLERRDFATTAAGGPEFAAILGDPVAHSLTPREQGPFFRARGWPVLRIRLLDEDLQSCDAFAKLRRLGLRAAAVTAPWKREARRWLAEHGGTFTAPPGSGDSDSCNTLGFTPDGRAHGTSTDGEGLAAAWHEARLQCGLDEGAEVALWGGGGTLSLLRAAFPQARSYAARSGAPRDGDRAAPAPAAVIWAVGRSRQAGCTWPPSAWRPRLVLDLNYADDSPGQEYAARIGARYVSGLTFFRAQAAAQRRFWSGLGL
ncbi:MAG: hypothetical protein U1A78_04885 [Polyangia bacterium]